MVEGKGKVTESDGKRTKQVMVRFPKYTVERIDDYAGDTHSSRPDFVIDSVRQYMAHIVGEAVTIITEIEGVDVSRQAKDMFFIERMGERMFSETESYQNSKESSPKGQDISVLVSFPMGLNDMIIRTVESTSIFSSNQEFIKIAVHWMLNHTSDVEKGLDVISEFQSTKDNGKSLEKELERIRTELQRMREE